MDEEGKEQTQCVKHFICVQHCACFFKTYLNHLGKF